MLENENDQEFDVQTSRGRITKTRHPKKVKRLMVIVSVAIVIVAASIGTYLYLHRNSGPLPQSVVKAANFPLYYPTPLPQGYAYVKGSAKLTGGVLFYDVTSGSKRIAISEQTTPPNPPDLSHLAGFTEFQTFAGSAALGTSVGRPIAIVLSNTTLISITAPQTVPSSIIGDLARAMNLLQAQ